MEIGHWWVLLVWLFIMLIGAAVIVAIIVAANVISHRLIDRDRRHRE